MDKQISSNLFNQFLSYFPEIELPFTLTNESRSEFSKVNRTFPEEMVRRILIPIDQQQSDEFTEYEPCLKLPPENDYIAVIYWKGQLLSYEFLIATFSKKGELISKKSIAGTKARNGRITTSVATIDQDRIIHIMIGRKSDDEEVYDPGKSRPMNMEILPTGDIVFSLQS